MTASCAISIVIAVFTLSHFAQLPRSEIVQLLGWYPYPCESLKCLALTAILFAGPFFEKAIIEGRWKSWVTLQPAFNELTTVIGVRNLVFGPISEELMFRSLLVPVFLHSPQSPTTTIFVLPLYFGIAHLHHFYEFLLTHPGTPWQHALIRSIFQFSYTTLFGWYGTFLFIRTRSFVGVTLAHSFCNFMGLPRFWGRVEGPDSATSHDKRRGVGQNTTRLNILWSVAYYIVLVAGAVLFKQNFWSLTESEMRLAVI